MTKTALTLFFCSLLLLAGVIGVYAFWYGIVGSASIHAAELASAIEAKNNESVRTRAAEKVLASLASANFHFDEYFISQADIVPFLARLEETGEAFGASIDIISVATEKQGTRVVLSLNTRLEGSFTSVLQTLGAIENGPYDLTTTFVSLGRSLVTDEESRWSASATFSVGTKDAAAPSAPAPVEASEEVLDP